MKIIDELIDFSEKVTYVYEHGDEDHAENNLPADHVDDWLSYG